MIETARTMMLFIKSAITGKPLVDGALPKLDKEDLKKLFAISRSHDLSHLVALGLEKNGVELDEEVKTAFSRQMLAAILRYRRIDGELKRICDTLERAKIRFIPLKGSVIRQLYPEPWMRTSCDIDILVDECRLDEAAKLIEGELHYLLGGKGSHDVSLHSENGVHLELHYLLGEDEIPDKYEKRLGDVWSFCTVKEGTEYHHLMSDAFFYYHHISHMAKHFSNGGCGVRPILDIWILSGVESDGSKKYELISECGLSRFTDAAEQLARVWFADGEHTPLTLDMEGYIILGGTYGTQKNRLAVHQNKRGGRLKYILSRLWMPYHRLKLYYPSLEGRKWLTPLYQVRRWFRLLSGGRMKRSINELNASARITEAERSSAGALLSSLGLD